MFKFFFKTKLIKKTGDETGVSTSSPAKQPTKTFVPKQTNHIRNIIKQTYKSEDLYVATAKYSGFGISNDLHLELNDIVGVIKKTDPCGNPLNWFIDNGSMTNN